MKAYVYYIAFIGLNMYFIIKYGRDYRKKIFTIPSFDGIGAKICTILYAILFNGTMVYSCFQDVDITSLQSWIGTLLFIVGFILFGLTLHTYATTSFDSVVTSGVYRITRNPQQLFAELLWIAVGISTQSLLIILLSIIKLFLLFPSMLAQERFCIEKYGKEYVEYMKRTPRYFFF